jgi:hypothetical protein
MDANQSLVAAQARNQNQPAKPPSPLFVVRPMDLARRELVAARLVCAVLMPIPA